MPDPSHRPHHHTRYAPPFPPFALLLTAATIQQPTDYPTEFCLERGLSILYPTMPTRNPTFAPTNFWLPLKAPTLSPHTFFSTTAATVGSTTATTRMEEHVRGMSVTKVDGTAQDAADAAAAS